MRSVRKQQRTTPDAQARRGAALVEMGVILPVLVVIAFGCVDFGRFVYAYAAVTNAAEEGAAFGSLNAITSFPGANFEARKAAWTTAVMNAAVAETSGLTPALTSANVVTVTNTPASGDTAGYVTVRVETVPGGYEFSMLAPGAFTYFGLDPTPTLARTVVMPRTR